MREKCIFVFVFVLALAGNARSENKYFPTEAGQEYIFKLEDIPQKLGNASISDILEGISVKKDFMFPALTPLLGNISDKCRVHSNLYLASLFFNASANTWAASMFDAMGKIPDGIFSETIDINEFAPGAYPFPIMLPIGNTKAYGAYEGCLDIVSDLKFDQLEQLSPNITTGAENFQGRYCMATITVRQEEDKKRMVDRMWREHFRLNNIDGKMAAVGGILSDIISALPDVVGGSTIGLAVTVASVTRPMFGACFPSVCSREDFLISINEYLSRVGLAVYTGRCYTKDDQSQPLEDGDVAMIVIMSIVGFFVLVGTASEMYRLLFESQDEAAPRSFILKLFECFSLRTNFAKLISTDSPKGSDQLDCLHGMRFLSMAWVILGHTWMMGLMVPTTNPLDGFKLIMGIDVGASFQIIVNALPSVDSFFFMSGVLVAYLTFKELDRSKGRLNLVMFYVHRYLRLTIFYAFIIGFEATLSKYTTSGPLSEDLDKGVSKACKDNWWTNLLYINNFVKQEEMCNGVSWYMANDMQFYVVSPLIIYPLWKWRRVGLGWWSSLILVFTFLPGYFTYKYDLPPSTGHFDAWTEKRLATHPEFDHNLDFYQRPYFRFQPYLVGIFLGYILHKTKGQKLRIPNEAVVVLWQVAILLAYLVVFGLYDFQHKTEVEGTLFVSVCYAAGYKLAWSLSLAWIVFACSRGYGGIINSFLSWGVFKPFSRLSYGMYLLHMQVIMSFLFSATYPFSFSHFTWTYIFISTICLTSAWATVASLLFEAPFMRLEKLLMGGRGKKSPKVSPNRKVEEDLIVMKAPIENQDGVNIYKESEGSTPPPTYTEQETDYQAQKEDVEQQRGEEIDTTAATSKSDSDSSDKTSLASSISGSFKIISAEVHSEKEDSMSKSSNTFLGDDDKIIQSQIEQQIVNSEKQN